MTFDAAAGAVIAGRYRLLRELGRGAMGTVHRARDLTLHREVAIKLIQPGARDATMARTRFVREARVAAQLRHPGAVQVHDFGEHEGHLFLVMELLTGAPLGSRITGRLPSIAEVVEIGEQLASVLEAAHVLGLVHRDIKPDNIFIQETSGGGLRVVLVDFGLAFIDQAEGDLGRVTHDGVLAGTPWYMAPEQARGRQVGPPADMYSLGCVIYELATGTAPFDGEMMDVLSRQLYARPEPPHERSPGRDIPPELSDVIVALLAKKPDQRPTAVELRAVLARIRRSAKTSRSSVILSADRQARMLSQGGDLPAVVASSAPGGESLGCVWLVALEDISELVQALAVAGIEAQTDTPSAPAAIFAPDATAAEVQELVKTRAVPVIARGSATDFERVTALLKAGASEVVMTTAGPDEIAQKIRRAIAKHRRAKRS